MLAGGLVLYFLGVAAGLVIMRDRWPIRVMTALAWPLGILSFGVVVVIQVVAAIYLWPIPVLATIGLLIGAWYIV